MWVYRYPALLLSVFAIFWILLALNPVSRQDWLLENALVFVALGVLFASYARFPLSGISYTLIFVFLCLHTIGAHFTYELVPYDRWTQELFGFSLNELLGWQRNNYDRVVHFSYGLLLAYPIREFMVRVADLRGFWGYFFPLDVTMSTSMLFELFEWGAAMLFGAELGAAYLGTQGDIWDAHKDMALASLGALIAMVVTAGLNRSLQRDFAREWAESLKVKHRSPLGEIEILRLWRMRRRGGRRIGDTPNDKDDLNT